MADPFALPSPSLPLPSAPTVPAVAPNASPAAIAKKAQDFEAMTIAQFLQPMFDTVKTSDGLFGGGPGEEAWKPMMIQEMAKQIASHGGFGLAKSIGAAMERAQHGPQTPGRPSMEHLLAGMKQK
jgi:Rod binding domain-containing protein